MLIISCKSSFKSRTFPQILHCKSLWIMRYSNFWNDNFVVFKFLTILYSYEASTLSCKIAPCIKKVFNGEEVFQNIGIKHCWGASWAKLVLIRVDSSIWQWWKLFFPGIRIYFLDSIKNHDLSFKTHKVNFIEGWLKFVIFLKLFLTFIVNLTQSFHVKE